MCAGNTGDSSKGSPGGARSFEGRDRTAVPIQPVPGRPFHKLPILSHGIRRLECPRSPSTSIVLSFVLAACRFEISPLLYRPRGGSYHRILPRSRDARFVKAVHFSVPRKLDYFRAGDTLARVVVVANAFLSTKSLGSGEFNSGRLCAASFSRCAAATPELFPRVYRAPT